MLGSGSRVVIDANVVAHNGTNPEARDNLLHGIYATGSDFAITNNVIHSNRSYGIQVAAYDYDPDSHAAEEFSDARNWLISNNTIALNRHSGGIVLWQDGVENGVVRNNIFYRNGGVNGVLFYSQQDRRHSARNNVFFPAGENLVSTEEGAYEASDNIEADPRLADADSFDFRLTEGSPAIDGGNAERAPATDLAGTARPQGAAVDVGAHEFPR